MKKQRRIFSIFWTIYYTGMVFGVIDYRWYIFTINYHLNTFHNVENLTVPIGDTYCVELVVIFETFLI